MPSGRNPLISYKVLPAFRSGGPGAPPCGREEGGRFGEAPWFFAAAVGAVAFLLPTLRYGMARDHALFAYYGWMILRGGPLCSNAFVIDMPGAAFLHAAQIALLGRSALAMRLMDFAWQAATTAALYAASRMLFGRLASLMCVWFYAFFYWNLGYWHTCQRDSFAMIWMLLAMVCLMRHCEEPRAVRWLAGCAAGCAGAVFFKGHFLILAPLAGAIVFLEYRRRGGKMARALAGAALLAAAPLVPLALYAIWHISAGQWERFRDSFIVGNWAYLHASAPRTLPLQPFLDASRFWLACAAAVGLLMSGGRAQPRRRDIGAAFLIVTALIPFVLRRFFEYHFTSFFCVACIFAGHAAERLSAVVAGVCCEGKPTLAKPARFIFLILIIAPYYASPAEGPQQFPKEILALARPGALRQPVAPVIDEDYQLPVVEAVSSFIAQNTLAGETVAVMDIDPALLYLAERLPPHILQSGAMMLIDTGSAAADALFARFRGEYAALFGERAPKFVIVPEGTLCWFYAGGKDVSARIRDFPQIDQALRENYEDMGKSWYYRIYIRRGDQVAPPR